MAYGPLTIDDSNNMAIFGTTNPKCYSAYSSGVILSWLHTNKNSVTPIKCIVNSGETISVYAGVTLGRASGNIILTMKEGTVFTINSIQQTLIMQGGTTYNDTNNLQLTGAITIYPDENKEFMDRQTNGYISLNNNPTSDWSSGRTSFSVIANENSKVKVPSTITEKSLGTTPQTSGITPIQLTYGGNKLNPSAISDTNVTKEYTDSRQALDDKFDGYTPLIDPYYPSKPDSWKEGGVVQEVEDYYNSLDSMDISKLRGIFGIPYQYLPTTDCRIDNSESEEVFGITYTEMIASRLPLLYITPGEPVFLSDAGDKKTSFLTDIVQFVGGGDSDHLNNLLSDYNGKLYSIESNYSLYFKYVNPMCRMGAFFLGLDSNSESDESYRKLDNVELTSYNWAWNDNGDYNGNYSGNDDGGSNNTGFSSLSGSMKDLQSAIYYRAAIPFYINSEVSFVETMNNETTESSLASGINGLSDKARELQFLIGSTTSAVAQNFSNAEVLNAFSSSKEAAEKMVSKLTGGNIFSSLFKNIKTVVSGGRLQFPNIWSNSTFSKSYSVNIKLTTPDLDKKSWFLNIYVPLCHLAALVLPRGEFQNGYTSPFIIKAFYKGMFNIDMGIITDMTFTKGKEGGWTKDCLPTVVDVSFTIQDLYSTLSLTPAGSLLKSNTMQNIAEMDYLANTCGVNINETDVLRMVNMFVTFNIKNVFMDVPTNITTGLGNVLSNKISKIYQSFI